MVVVDECKECGGECCKNLAIEIDAPESKEDLEDIKWYLFHKDVEVYVDEDGTWNVQFNSRCKHLNEDNLCDIYPNRPPMCRGFSSRDCDLNVKNITSFTNLEEFEGWLEKNKGTFLKKRSRKK